MLHVVCSGSPYEIGLKHGTEAKSQVSGSIAFYAGLFRKSAEMEWPKVRELALNFEVVIRAEWPAYLDEMKGVADGAGVHVTDIIALNVRTEITFGMYTDGCTALSWKTSRASYLAQNWDWQTEQKENLIVLTISQPLKPTIKMITEAGLIGKIGFNSAGVGVCLNAIKARGMDATRLPCHLGLRMVLESDSMETAVRSLERYGVASSCHMLIADTEGSVGVEWSSVNVKKVDMNRRDQVFHSNHYLLEHGDVEDSRWLEDSTYRVKRIEALCEDLTPDPSYDDIANIFRDEGNHPGSICRQQVGKSLTGTLFNIVMDLNQPWAQVKLGRPVAPDETFELKST